MTMGMDARHVYSRPACTYSFRSSNQFAIQCPQIALSKMPRAQSHHLDLEAMRVASSVSCKQSKVSRRAVELDDPVAVAQARARRTASGAGALANLGPAEQSGGPHTWPTSTLPVVRMQEDLNIEIAGTLAEGEGKDAQARSPKTGWEEVVEILEAFLLAFVAIATAWSGYQAARWDGREASSTRRPRRSVFVPTSS